MRRRLFTLCTALSLLLCAAACALWVRSYRRLDRLSADVGGAERSIAVVRGMVHWFCSPDPDHTYPTGYSSVRPGEWHTARGQVVRVGGRRDVFPGNPVLARHWSGCVTASGRCSPCVAEYPEASPAGPVLRVVPLQQITSPRPPGYRRCPPRGSRLSSAAGGITAPACAADAVTTFVRRPTAAPSAAPCSGESSKMARVARRPPDVASDSTSVRCPKTNKRLHQPGRSCPTKRRRGPRRSQRSRRRHAV